MAMADGNATETAAAMVDGDRNGNGQRQWQWATATAMMKGDDDKGRVVASCAGDVQRYGRGDTLPPPPWTQRKVHSPARIMEVTLLGVFPPFQGEGFLTAHHGLFFCLLFTTTVQFTEQPSVCPPHYSGAQEPCQPIDALPPPLLQESLQPIDNLPQLLLHFLSR
jgi:hypothetical protein